MEAARAGAAREGRGGQERSSSFGSGVSSGVGVSPGFNRHPPSTPYLRLELVCSRPGAWNTNQLSTFELLLVEKEANNTKTPIPCRVDGSEALHSSRGRVAEPGWPCVLRAATPPRPAPTADPSATPASGTLS